MKQRERTKVEPHLTGKIKTFVNDNPINVGETKAWISLIEKYISQNGLKSRVLDGGSGINLYKREQQELESMLSAVEDEPTTLYYIFEGNINYSR